MAAANRESNVILRYEVDTAAVQRLLQTNDRVEGDIEALRAELLQLSPAARSAVQAVEARFDRLDTTVDAARASLDLLNDEMRETARISQQIDDLSGGEGLLTAERVGHIRAIRQEERVERFAIGTLTGIVPGGAAGGAFGAFVEAVELVGALNDLEVAFDAFAASLKQNVLDFITSPIALAAGAAVGLALALGEVARQFEESKQRAIEFLNTQSELFQQAAGDLERRRDELRQQIAAQETTNQRFSSLLAEYDAIIARLGQEAPQLPLFALEEQSQAALDAVLRDEEERRAATERRIELERELAALTGGQITNFEVLRSALADTGTETESLRAELALVERTIEERASAEDALRAIIASGIQSVRGFVNAMGALIDVENKAAGVIIGRAGAVKNQLADEAAFAAATDRKLAQNALVLKQMEELERVERARAQVASSYLDAISATVRAQAALAAAQAAYDEAARASSERFLQIDAELREAQAAAGEEQRQAVLDAETQAAEDRQKLIEDTARERLRIERQFERARSNAIAERDVLAAVRAEQQRDDELRTLDEQYDAQLKMVDDQLRKQLAVIERRYADQLRAAQRAYDQAVAAERQRQETELAIRRQAIQQAQVDLINASNAELALRQSYHQASIGQTVNWANALLQIGAQAYQGFINLLSGLPAFGGSYTGGGGGAPAYPTPLAPTPTTGSAPVYTFNFVGATTQTIKTTSRREVLQTMDKILIGMGAT